jgi:uncharacterized membrane protein
MAEPVQNYQNHARWFPMFHYFALPVLFANFINAARHVWTAPSFNTAFAALVAAAIMILAVATRQMTTTVQDRIIRLEMRLRLKQVLPADLQGRIDSLTRGQLVALRFASDAELPDLVREVLDGRLQTAKDIKQKVKNWQADWLRA